MGIRERVRRVRDRAITVTERAIARPISDATSNSFRSSSVCAHTGQLDGHLVLGIEYERDSANRGRAK